MSNDRLRRELEIAIATVLAMLPENATDEDADRAVEKYLETHPRPGEPVQ